MSKYSAVTDLARPWYETHKARKVVLPPGHQGDRRRGLGDVPTALGPCPGQLDELLAAGDDYEVPRMPVPRRRGSPSGLADPLEVLAGNWLVCLLTHVARARIASQVSMSPFYRTAPRPVRGHRVRATQRGCIFMHHHHAVKRPLLRAAGHRQHDVPVPSLGCCPGKNLNQRPVGLQQASPTGAGSKAGLEVMPIDSVTPGDEYAPGERMLTRRYGVDFGW
jgi:hypothetical protein